MKEAVDDRREYDAGDAQKRDAAVNRIATGKYLAASSPDRRERPHAGKDHGGIHKGINPRQVFIMMVSCDAENE